MAGWFFMNGLAVLNTHHNILAADKTVDKHQYHDRVHKVGKDGRNREQKERDHRAEVGEDQWFGCSRNMFC